jgi:hypothetical protein
MWLKHGDSSGIQGERPPCETVIRRLVNTVIEDTLVYVCV